MPWEGQSGELVNREEMELPLIMLAWILTHVTYIKRNQQSQKAKRNEMAAHAWVRKLANILDIPDVRERACS